MKADINRVGSMGLKLIIEDEGKVILEVPLSPDDWHRRELVREVDQLRRDARRNVKFYEAFTNANRVRMLHSLLECENHTLTFKEFMTDLGLNPKTIRENAVKLQNIGFIESPSRGEYRLSKRGQLCFMMTVIAMRRMLQTIREEYSE
jgi:DNA-binding HxlR family transcriptional regulator